MHVRMYTEHLSGHKGTHLSSDFQGSPKSLIATKHLNEQMYVECAKYYYTLTFVRLLNKSML